MSRPHTDHYAVLGVEPSASDRRITTAYRRLVRSLHPDTATDDAAGQDALAAVVAAYAILRDPQRRAAYDAAREQGPPRATSGPVPVRVTCVVGPSATATGPHGAPLRAGPVRVGVPVREAPAAIPVDLLRWVWGMDPRW
ncbi:J domain-containing protein [Streptomyces sp. ISL-10]|uniref:J domain-containing protein n=1 Tax=Streptomyces sp. ISL-10 TaxID=2819172 RepID=UPI001BE725F2|nr:J domain-containing protein [Streptomyces sp. ISL-10]MBT2365677.1 J domain-containing protein [Streptomyces sp. ISL-10]